MDKGYERRPLTEFHTTTLVKLYRERAAQYAKAQDTYPKNDSLIEVLEVAMDAYFTVLSDRGEAHLLREEV